MDLAHFRNGLRCEHHKHGASCAIDVLLEVYFHGIYIFDINNYNNDSTVNGQLLTKLNDICMIRKTLNEATCYMREDIWDLLCHLHPGAFVPKGRHDAEAREGFIAIANSSPLSRLSVQVCTISRCQNCSEEILNTSEIPLLPLTYITNGKCNGNLSKGIEEELKCVCRHALLSTCQHCQSDGFFSSASITFPDYLIVELGLIQGHNRQKPPVKISECCEVFNSSYQLTASVQMQPGHFYSVVRKGEEFVILDGLKETQSCYKSFTGAVLKNDIEGAFHTTSVHHDGIHMLIFRRTTISAAVEFSKYAELDECNYLDIPASVPCSKEQNNTYSPNEVNHPGEKIADTPTFRSPVNKAENDLLLSTPNQGQTKGPYCMSSDKSGNGTLTLSNGSMSYIMTSGKMYFSCHDAFDLAGMKTHVKKQGYKFIDSTLHKHNINDTFIYNNKTRLYISFEAFLQLLDQRIGNKLAKETLKLDLAEIKNLTINHGSKVHNQTPNKCAAHFFNMEKFKQKNQAPSVSGTLNLDSKTISYIVKEEKIFLACKDILDVSGLTKHVEKNGYIYIDNHLKDEMPMKDTFIYSGRERIFIHVSGVQTLLGKIGSLVQKQLQKEVKRKLFVVLEAETCLDLQMKKHLSTPQKCKFMSPINVDASPIKRTPTSKPKARKKVDFNSAKSKKLPQKPAVVMPTRLETAHNLAEKQLSFSATDLIHIEENFSGTRLMEEMRKKLPGILPSQRNERIQKKQYYKEFQAILLPKRTKTGWSVDPNRLMDILLFRYYWLESKKHWRIYGDGREIGGRQSTFLSISPINNEVFLRGHLFQSPKEIYPICIFYESDSRDNLEQNLESNGPLNAFITSQSQRDHVFYLCGDEMFLQAILAAEGLSPISEEGWNIYSRCNKAQKKETASTGLRTDLQVSLNRHHPKTLIPSIPIHQTIFCLLHGLARCVEKFLNLEIDNILSEGNKSTQRGVDATSYIQEKVANLENNINKRGIRQGNFRIHFDAKGAPEPVSLNKTHAFAILAPPPPNESELSFPHVLQNVVGMSKVVLNVPPDVKHTLQLKDTYTEIEFVKTIWNSFWTMVTILSKDPEPILLDGCLEGSLKPDDYQWGYTELDRTMYRKHAEVFFQLHTHRYSYVALTPYMIKLIDVAPVFMDSLPFPVSRFQSEGGEHANYEHNCFYYQHTTRHGGKKSQDPVVAIFTNMYKRLAYDISLPSDSEGDEDKKDAKTAFNMYCNRHLDACMVQKVFRGHYVRRIFHEAGWIAKPQTAAEVTQKKEASKMILDIFQRKPTQQEEKLFTSFSFVLCGAIPKLDKIKYTQDSFTTLLKENGAEVKGKLPGKGKGTSTKQYTVLASKTLAERTRGIGVVKQAIRKAFDVLDFSYVTESLKAKSLVKKEEYSLNLDKLSSGITKDVNLHKRHFSHTKSMLTLTKGTRKKKWKAPSVFDKVKKPASNATVHFVLKRRSEIAQETKMTFKQSQSTFKELFKTFRTMSPRKKRQNQLSWEKEKEQYNLLQERIQRRKFGLKEHNKIMRPAYSQLPI